MKYAAIPTVYNGIQFRSRLEAKWACFFDLIEWAWEYEPVDLDGWIPDFVISHSTYRVPLYVEVKPEIGYAENHRTLIKIEQCLGAPKPRELRKPGDRLPSSKEWDDFFANTSFQVMLVGPALQQIQICSNKPPYYDEIVGFYYALGMTMFPRWDYRNDYPDYHFTRRAWKKATNIVQWEAPR